MFTFHNLNYKKLRKEILDWYELVWEDGINQYPWRIEIKNPYEILIAEILLQHTTAKAIIENDIYKKFLKKFPSLDKINRNKKQDLINILKPIGLYNQKSERLLKLKQKIYTNYNGLIPKNKRELLEIPGIGDYIASAILTFAFNKNEVPLDNNLRRIGLNVWNLKSDNELKLIYKNLAKTNPKKIYWALFDIGWFNCRKPIPKCNNCVFRKICFKNNN